MRFWLFLLTALSLSLGAAGAKTPSAALAVRDPVIRPAFAGMPTTAAYMTIFNVTGHPITLNSAACDCAASVTAHESKIVGGMMQMDAAPALTVPPHGNLRFQPGGLHLMVMGLKQPLKLGETVPMQLTFTGMKPVTVRFTVAR